MSHCPGSMNQRAKEIVDITTGQTEETKKAPSRAKSGKARAAKLSPARKKKVLLGGLNV